ncbi:aspartate kinase [Kiritimatiella glycovorans]|uniref:Aspartokinase n=1 Tax=Kiritimatiella glycovorans TaxID=1307763 RepID=A0A0G3EFG0_9BACT|nr:aspartate kinase [Kiritimatiella glycovorans]AKJ65083.1 Aspartokinase [Kiritimatiella glycovorans]
MARIVQKYGGSSVADADCMRRVAQRIHETREAGNDVVVVVSAMGDTTDELIQLAQEVHASPDDREMDQLMAAGEQISSSVLTMALHAMGCEAVSMTGPQAGIRTDAAHTRAKITGIDPARVHQALGFGRVVIIAGFQGLTPASDVATLGRGGSDTTAVALAAALEADKCQIFTDVDGVYTTDPRICSGARKLDRITCDEVLELASLGAKVLHSRSVEIAKKYGVRLEVLSSFKRSPGTEIVEGDSSMEDVVVRGIAADKGQCKVTLHGVPDSPGVAARVFHRLADHDVNVDMIVQNVSEEGHTNISFTIPVSDMKRAKTAADELSRELEAQGVDFDEDIAKVSIVGIGMKSHSGVASRMFSALAEHGINIGMISTSEIKISIVIARDSADEAVRVLHKSFELE